MHPYYGFGPTHSLIYLMFFGFFGVVISIRNAIEILAKD